MSIEMLKALLQFLRGFVTRFAEDIEAQYRGDERLRAQAERIHDAEGVGEDLNSSYLPRLARRNAVSFALKVFFIRVLEDRGLLPLRRVRSTDAEGLFDELFPNLGAREYLEFAVREGFRLLPDLFDDQPCDLTLPGENTCQEFLDGWRRMDPDSGGLLYEFTPAVGGFETRFLGDVYENLDEETAKKYALRQTPDFITRFILEHTLLKCIEEKSFWEVSLIDPTCGSGHFLLDAFWVFVRHYEAAVAQGVLSAEVLEPRDEAAPFMLPEGEQAFGAPERSQLTGETRLAVYRKIVEEHLYGADIVEMACELARFRLLLAGLDYVGRDELDRLSDSGGARRALGDVRLNVVCCDSLVPHELLPGRVNLYDIEGLPEDERIRQFFGERERRRDARRVFYKKYDVCVGNPPYVMCDDARKRAFYRTGKDEDGNTLISGFRGYTAASGKYQLGSPFTERFFGCVSDGGWVGLINSNAFARRSFGKALVEKVLPQHDLSFVADCSGVFIPGHGTPTVILAGRRSSPRDESLWVLSCLQGEPETPEDPVDGQVWQAVLRAFRGMAHGREYEDDWVALARRSRTTYCQYPWSFGGVAMELLERLDEHCSGTFGDLVESIGFHCIFGQQDAFIYTPSEARRLRIPAASTRPLLYGEVVRDHFVTVDTVAIFPYNEKAELAPVDRLGAAARCLRRFIALLAARPTFSGRTYAEEDRPWHEYHQLPATKCADDLYLVYADIATHNHFVPIKGRWLCNRTSPIVKLPTGEPFERYFSAAGLLNSSVACFLMKMVCFEKGACSDTGILAPDPDRFRFEFAGEKVAMTPIARLQMTHDQLLRRLARECAEAGEAFASALPDQALFVSSSPFSSTGGGYAHPGRHKSAWADPWESARELRTAFSGLSDRCGALRARMCFLQEEIDWLCYGLYGLVEASVLAQDYMTEAETAAAKCAPEERPFVLSRSAEGDPGVGADMLPAHYGEAQAALWKARIRCLCENRSVAIVETPMYKRRWATTLAKQPLSLGDWLAKRFGVGLRDWLLEMVEYELEHWTGFSCVTGTEAGEPYRPCEDVEPELRQLAMAQTARPVHISELADRLAQKPKVAAAMELYADTEHFDARSILRDLMLRGSVPASDELLHTESGLRKLEAWGLPWKLSDEEAIKLPKPPEFKRVDFQRPSDRYWKIRRKLNVPRERFIQYAEVAAIGGQEVQEGDEGWFGWAGWDPRQRADALYWLLEDLMDRKGIAEFQQCPLRIPLRNILAQGQLEAKDDPQPSISPLPPCDVSHEDLRELTTIATFPGSCGRKLDAECPCPEYREWLAENPPIRRRRTGRRAEPKVGEPEQPTEGAKRRAPSWARLDDAQRSEIRQRVRLFVEGQAEARATDIGDALPDIERKYISAALKDLVVSQVLAKRGKGSGTTYRRSGQQRLLDEA